MALTIKSLIKELVDLEELECVKALITLKESKYGDAIDKLLALDNNIIPSLLAKSKLEDYSSVSNNTNNVIALQQPIVVEPPVYSHKEVFSLKQFRDLPKVKEDELVSPSLEVKVFKRLTIEQQMVLLTIAWAQKPSPSSYIIKHCQRISSFFDLHQDDRWRTYYTNNRTKMQTLITNTILKFKKSGLVIETKMQNMNKHSVYHLTKLGVSVSRLIAQRVGFSLDTAI